MSNDKKSYIMPGLWVYGRVTEITLGGTRGAALDGFLTRKNGLNGNGTGHGNGGSLIPAPTFS
jgi:hypothetical protein